MPESPFLAFMRMSVRIGRWMGIVFFIGGLVALFFAIAQPTGPLAAGPMQSFMHIFLAVVGIGCAIYGLVCWKYAPKILNAIFKQPAADERQEHGE